MRLFNMTPASPSFYIVNGMARDIKLVGDIPIRDPFAKKLFYDDYCALGKNRARVILSEMRRWPRYSAAFKAINYIISTSNIFKIFNRIVHAITVYMIYIIAFWPRAYKCFCDELVKHGPSKILSRTKGQSDSVVSLICNMRSKNFANFAAWCGQVPTYTSVYANRISRVTIKGNKFIHRSIVS